jgi:hypothetical protein
MLISPVFRVWSSFLKHRLKNWVCEEQITKEVLRDIEMAKENDARGLNLTTAGSINNGSLLSSMRLIMALIQNYGRY